MYTVKCIKCMYCIWNTEPTLSWGSVCVGCSGCIEAEEVCKVLMLYNNHTLKQIGPNGLMVILLLFTKC